MVTVGIDFGTYNSKAGYKMPDGTIILLQSNDGDTRQGRVTPSFVEFHPNGQYKRHGEEARKNLVISPERVVWGVKRLLGLSYDMAKESGELEKFTYNYEKATDGSIVIKIGAVNYSPEQIATIFLTKLKEDCESTVNPLNGIITDAVISCPAYFGDRVEAVKHAAELAGFKNIVIIKEPEAAAIAYKDYIDFSKNERAMVIDWGGGTLDIVIARFLIKDGNPRIQFASKPYGNNSCGGLDIDEALLAEAKQLYNLGKLNPKDSNSLNLAVEEAKIDLSGVPFIIKFCNLSGRQIKLCFARDKSSVPLGNDLNKYIILEDVLTKNFKKFEDGGILGELEKWVRFTLKEEKLTTKNIKQLILVGGPLLMPSVRKRISDIFADNGEIKPSHDDLLNENFANLLPVGPFDAVVKGATLYADGGVVVDGGQSAFGYGYILNDYCGGILVRDSMILPREGILKQLEFPLTRTGGSQVKAGTSIHVSILKEVKTPSMGINPALSKFFKKGDYEFVPYVSEGGITQFTPSVFVDKNECVRLTIKDELTGQELSLKLTNHKDVAIEKPTAPSGDVDPGDIDASDLTPTIDVKEVLSLRRKAQGYLAFVEDKGLNSGEIRTYFERLQSVLDNLPIRTLVGDEQRAYINVVNTINLLKVSLIEGGVSEEALGFTEKLLNKSGENE
jgi:molecular chaperone DnaK (HSP70)